MRILYYIHSLQTGGAEIVVTEYLLALNRRGHDVALVVNNHCGSPLEAALAAQMKVYSLLSYDLDDTVRSLGKSVEFKTRRLRYKGKWRSIIGDFRPDLIHIHTLANDIDRIPFPADRMVYSFHTDVERCLRISNAMATTNLETLAAGGMSFFAINKKIQEEVSRRFNTKRSYYTPNGLDLDKIRSMRIDKESFLAKLGFPPDTFVAGHVGRLNPVKNHGKVISVFAEIARRKAHSVLLLIGRGTDEEFERVKAQADASGFSDRILFLGERPDSAALMSAMDVLLFPSLIEGFPLTLIEAQAKGLRCVISDKIPDDVICCGNCIPLSLDASDSQWADVALGSDRLPERKDIAQYDINNAISGIESLYLDIVNS